jgi:DNA invertase Pin-like site-specific DNA recombinase
MDTNTKVMKVAVYGRVSMKNKGQEVSNQLDVLREFCGKMGYHIYQEYVDHESGGSSNRSAFNQMFADAAQRKFDLVLFWSLDRFSREGTRRTIFLLQQLDDCGVQYRSYTEQYIDSSGIFKDVIISLLSTLALQEKTRLADRVLCGLERARRNGRIGGRPRIPQEKIDRINNMKDQGMSLRRIAKELNIHHGTVTHYLNN